MERRVGYDVNSHVFESYIKNGKYDPYADTIVYDGGNLDIDYDDNIDNLDRIKDNGNLENSK